MRKRSIATFNRFLYTRPLTNLAAFSEAESVYWQRMCQKSLPSGKKSLKFLLSDNLRSNKIYQRPLPSFLSSGKLPFSKTGGKGL